MILRLVITFCIALELLAVSTSYNDMEVRRAEGLDGDQAVSHKRPLHDSPEIPIWT